MAQFRKKPVTIEAARYCGGGNIIHLDTPQWLIEAAEAGIITAVNEGLSIKTLEGDMAVSPGDWIIRGIKGEPSRIAFARCTPILRRRGVWHERT